MTLPTGIPGANPDPAQVPPAPALTDPSNPPTPTPPSTDPAGTRDPLDEPLREPGLRALHAEREARAAAERKQRELEQQVAEFQQRDMTELQRAQAQLAEMTEKVEAAERSNLRNTVALEFNIPSADLVLLTGTTEEELRAQATRVQALNAQQTPAPGVPAFAPNPGQAAGNGNPPVPNTATVDAGRSLYKQRNSKSN